MKLALTMMMVLAAGSVAPAQAFPGGGWDANDARLSISHSSKLLAPAPKGTTLEEFPRGGWDGNDARLSINSGSKLLAPKQAAEAHPGGGWDLNDAKLSIAKGSKLLPQAK